MPTIVFHSPLHINREGLSGSSVRPKEMLRAFREIGVNVFVIDGDSKKRRKRWREALNASSKIAGVYSELSTLPIALTDPDHIPRKPFMDMAMFREMRRRGIPVTAFYRDIYWRYPQYANEFSFFPRLALKCIAIPLYWLELHQLSRSVSHVFLPSMRMASAIPITFPNTRISSLPPGSTSRSLPHDKKNTRKAINFLYIGGVLPPTYDLSDILHVIKQHENATLTICCRFKEWEAAAPNYSIPDNVSVVHASGKELDGLYANADACLMYRKMDPYLRFAMPVKLFEAIGAGLPVITNSNCEAGDLVTSQNLGWSLPDKKSLNVLIETLVDAPELIEEKKRKVEQAREKHTWQSRANQVLRTFEELRATNSI